MIYKYCFPKVRCAQRFAGTRELFMRKYIFCAMMKLTSQAQDALSIHAHGRAEQFVPRGFSYSY